MTFMTKLQAVLVTDQTATLDFHIFLLIYLELPKHLRNRTPVFAEPVT